VKHIILEKAQKKFSGDIQDLSIKNNYFRKVLFTSSHLQLVVMSLSPGEDIGNEKHEVDQFFRIEQGEATFYFEGKDKAVFGDGGSAVVPAGMYHNVVNTGKTDLKLYTVYSPPNHPAGTIHKTKAEALERGD